MTMPGMIIPGTGMVIDTGMITRIPMFTRMSMRRPGRSAPRACAR